MILRTSDFPVSSRGQQKIVLNGESKKPAGIVWVRLKQQGEPLEVSWSLQAVADLNRTMMIIIMTISSYGVHIRKVILLHSFSSSDDRKWDKGRVSAYNRRIL